MTLEIFSESRKLPTFSILLIIVMRSSILTFFTYFSNLLDMLSTPELVLVSGYGLFS